MFSKKVRSNAECGWLRSFASFFSVVSIESFSFKFVPGWLKFLSNDIYFSERRIVSCGLSGCVLYYCIFGGTEVSKFLEVGRRTLVILVKFHVPFGLWFWRHFVITFYAIFYLVGHGLPFFSGVFCGVIFLYVLVFFIFSHWKSVVSIFFLQKWRVPAHSTS